MLLENISHRSVGNTIIVNSESKIDFGTDHSLQTKNKKNNTLNPNPSSHHHHYPPSVKQVTPTPQAKLSRAISPEKALGVGQRKKEKPTKTTVVQPPTKTGKEGSRVSRAAARAGGRVWRCAAECRRPGCSFPSRRGAAVPGVC